MKSNITKILRGMLVVTVFFILSAASMVIAEEEGIEPAEENIELSQEEAEPAEENIELSQVVTILGVVGESYNLISDDGTIYYIGVGTAGDELVEKVGERVTVRGHVVEDQGEMVLDVISFQLIK